MKKLFKHGRLITQDILDKIKCKTYHSGRQKEVDDIEHWAYIRTSDNSITLSTLCSKDFHLYENDKIFEKLTLNPDITVLITTKRNEEDIDNIPHIQLKKFNYE